MSPGPVLQEVPFSKAKASLSEVMDQVVHDHQPRVVLRKGREEMLLVRRDDLAEWLAAFRLDIGLILDEGEVTAEARGLDVLGFGETVDDALQDLASELRAYATRFFEDSAFYRKTNRARHYPLLLRFALTPPESHVELLHGDISAAAANRPREALTSVP